MPDMEPISKVVDSIKENFEKLGLYLINTNIATTDQEAVAAAAGDVIPAEDFRKKLADGDTKWMVTATFTIGDVAFTDRVLNPKAFEEETEFLVAVPDEIDIIRQKMIDAVAAGDFLAAFEEDDAGSSDS